MRQTRDFAARPESVPAARRFASGMLRHAPSDLREVVELMVSELATNCIRHVNASFQLTIESHGDKVNVEVRDQAEGRPAMRSPAPGDSEGRGLRIIDLLAARWGVRYDSDAGKTVWFTLLAVPRDDDQTRESEFVDERQLAGSSEQGPGSPQPARMSSAA